MGTRSLVRRLLRGAADLVRPDPARLDVLEREAATATNRRRWDEAAPVHAESQLERLMKGFATPGFSCLPAGRRDALLAHGIAGRAVVHLCCNNGRDVLSIKNLGAARAVGFDFSAAFIEQGRRLAAAGAIDCELVCSDVYAIPHAYDGQFDVAYLTAGTFRALPDVAGLFAVIARLVRPGGWLYVEEMHPIIDMLSMEPSREPRRLRYSYFDRRPFLVTGGLDYWRARRYRASAGYGFHHTLGDILDACTSSGFRLERFVERPTDSSGGTFRRLERARAQLPLSYVLTAVRA